MRNQSDRRFSSVGSIGGNEMQVALLRVGITNAMKVQSLRRLDDWC
jgi:hypothetical protein